MNRKAIGSVLMILGTSIGAGMLALPIVTAQESYLQTVILMLLSWGIMTLGGFAVLEVNLWTNSGSNIITMAKVTLGRFGKFGSWLIYLLLLYSLLCAYLAGSGDVFQALLTCIHINIPLWCSTTLALLLLSIVVYRGVSSIDIVNRLFMGTKLLAYCILVLAIVPHIHFKYIAQGGLHIYGGTVMVMMTSFGYAIIVPSLRSYLNSDVKLLKRVILVGSMLPLLIYLIWAGVVQGLVQRTGSTGLLAMLNSSHATSMLMASISALSGSKWLAEITKVFVSICAVTSFLGVSLCITDFMADGLKCTKFGVNAIKVYALSYLPPLVIVLLAPGVFVSALHYAGECCVLLLILLPMLMLYSGRYLQNRSGVRIISGGKTVILITILFAILVMIMG